jgi:zinc transport system substrate-binding protein
MRALIWQKRSLCVSLLFLMCLGLSSVKAAADEAPVIVSIRPLQWVVQALLPPEVPVVALMPVGQSPHEYALRPADIGQIQASALLVWVGPGMEPWLTQLAARLPPGRVLALLPDTGLHNHQHDHDTHEHHTTGDALTVDPHLWLDPVALVEVSSKVAVVLQQRFPQQAVRIRERLAVFQAELGELHAMAWRTLLPVREKGFVVYHDSYGRLVSRYGLKQLAAVWRHEAIPAGVRERAALLALLQKGDVQCVFHEPEYGHDAVQGWLSSDTTGIRVKELDPLGDRVTGSGGDAYAVFFKALIRDVHGCLAGNV